MLDLPGLEDEVPSEFPRTYFTAEEWVFPLPKRIVCLIISWALALVIYRTLMNDTLSSTLSISYAANPTHSQCYGSYRDPAKP